jgi:hypothetical protein
MRNPFDLKARAVGERAYRVSGLFVMSDGGASMEFPLGYEMLQLTVHNPMEFLKTKQFWP